MITGRFRHQSVCIHRLDESVYKCQGFPPKSEIVKPNRLWFPSKSKKSVHEAVPDAEGLDYAAISPISKTNFRFHKRFVYRHMRRFVPLFFFFFFFFWEYRNMRRFSFLSYRVIAIGDEFLSISYFSIGLAFSLRESPRQLETETVLFLKSRIITELNRKNNAIWRGRT